MSRVFTSGERRRLNVAAREYERKGYRVIKEPETTDMPDFLATTHPAMIAYGDSENVVLEVRSSATLPQARDLVPLAKAVDGQPGWRLELRVVGSRPYQDASLLDWWEIKHRLADARELLEDQHDAAILLASAAAEATVRLVAKRNGVRLNSDGQDAGIAAVKKLYSLGLVDRDDYEAIDAGSRLRNLIMHGYRPPETTRDIAARLIGGVEHLLAEVPEQLAS